MLTFFSQNSSQPKKLSESKVSRFGQCLREEFEIGGYDDET